jgi:metal-sulfur cluster biosynthetic enzyme
MALSKQEMKEKVLEYLQFMEDKDLREINVAIYNLSKVRETLKNHKEGSYYD